MKYLLPVSMLTLILTASATEAMSSFDPQGTWNLRFEDSCSGSTRYTGHAQAVKGSEFVCSSYLDKKKPPAQAELEIHYDVKTQTVILTGGPSVFPRTVHLDSDKIGVSDVKLFPKTTTEAPGCDLQSYVLESVRFTNSDRMQYGYVTVYEFTPHAHQSCAPYLSNLKAAIKRRTATGLLLAMRDIHAVNVDQMQSLSILDVYENYIGTRNERG